MRGKSTEEAMVSSGMNAVEMLKADHRKVEGLFEQFESSTTKREKMKLIKEVINELTLHTKLEEKLVYPILLEEKEEEDMAQEAFEEHHVVKNVLKELSSMDGSEENLKAKMKVLSELVDHHVQEEEKEMFPALEKTGEDLTALGEKISQEKMKLMQRGSGRRSTRASAKSSGRKTATRSISRSTTGRRKAS
ncbi:MAG: hemerythrin domain-containing protein [Candidatus Obscuribacterales bacterium]|nr:hemerythrin domain-containing protein [Candidatus Obscuribacterales bacterium]